MTTTNMISEVREKSARSGPREVFHFQRVVHLRWIAVAMSASLSGILLGCGDFPDSSGTQTAASVDSASDKSSASGEPGSGKRVRVGVVHPTSQGESKKREITQPGSCQAFEVVDLYAKVAGYLKNQKVDIGDEVKDGKLLAEIDAPELEHAVMEAQAQVRQAQAQTTQKTAAVSAAAADLTAAQAALRQAQADLDGYAAEVKLRKLQYNRIKTLAEQKAVEEELVDEKAEQQQVALSKQSAAEKAVGTAEADVEAAKGHVDEAKADLAAAKAAEELSQASLKKAQQFLDYTKIRAPLDGVITARNYYNGDFIRAATGGQSIAPLLRVARDDKMRIVVQIPAKDAPHIRQGDAAAFAVESLPNRNFSGVVSRIAKAQAYKTRTMRVEIDLDNPEGLLQDGMYGAATITLEHAAPGVVIPSKCLFTSAEGTRFVYVIKENAARQREVEVDVDNGVTARIAVGLGPKDRVVSKHGAGIADGVAVEVIPETGESSPAKSGSDASGKGSLKP